MSLVPDTDFSKGSLAAQEDPRHFTVLIVDQDRESASQVTKGLESAGVQVLYADSGTQGVWLAISKEPDAVVTELGMKNGDGAEILEFLKGCPQTDDIPVVVHTSQDYPGMQHHLEQLGAAAVFDKSVEGLNPLLDTVGGLLNLSE